MPRQLYVRWSDVIFCLMILGFRIALSLERFREIRGEESIGKARLQPDREQSKFLVSRCFASLQLSPLQLKSRLKEEFSSMRRNVPLRFRRSYPISTAVGDLQVRFSTRRTIVCVAGRH